jgi:hypothetical protein
VHLSRCAAPLLDYGNADSLVSVRVTQRRVYLLDTTQSSSSHTVRYY